MFEFYFQSGEFFEDGSFLQDLLVQIIGTATGAALAAWSALWLYKRSTAQQDAIKKADKEKFEHDKLLYLAHLIRGSSIFMTNLVSSCEELVKHTREMPYSIGQLDLTPSDDLVRAVDQINREVFYHAYRNKFPDQNIVKAFTALDASNRIRLNIDHYWAEAKKSEIGLKNQIRDYLEGIIRSRNQVLLEEHESKEILFRLEAIQKVLENISQENIGNYDFLDSEYFTQIMQALSPSNLMQFKEYAEIHHLSLKGRAAIQALKKSNLYFVTKLEATIITANRYLQSLNDNSKNITQLS